VKAFLLSAGLGIRLRPLTDDIPKCLVEINGKPLLYIWLDLLEKEGIDEVLINTHYFAEKVEEAVNKRKNRIKVKLFYEAELLGSGGTVLANDDFVRNEKDFFFIFADNLSNVSLKRIYDFHVFNKSLFTTYVYKTDVPKQKGIFVYDLNGKVMDFEEKPEYPKSNIASAGIGVLSNKVFEIMRKNYEFGIMNDEFQTFTTEQTKETENRDFSGKEQKDKSSDEVMKLQSDELIKSSGRVIDFGKDVMPELLSNMYVMETNDYIRDIGTLKDLDEARASIINYEL